MSETANQTKNFAELAGRTQPVVGDVVMAMVNMGMSFKDLDVRNLEVFSVMYFNPCFML